MKKTSSVVGFLMALSALNIPMASAKSPIPNDHLTIDSRIETIANTIKEKEAQLNNSSLVEKVDFQEGVEIAGFSNWKNGNSNFRNWRNGWHDSGWRNSGSWRNGGGFNNWFNGWRNGGPFINFRNW